MSKHLGRRFASKQLRRARMAVPAGMLVLLGLSLFVFSVAVMKPATTLWSEKLTLNATVTTGSWPKITPTVVTDNPKCKELGYASSFKIDVPGGQQLAAGAYGNNGFHVTISNLIKKPNSNEVIGFTWAVTDPAYPPVTMVIVKGGTSSNIYNYVPPLEGSRGPNTVFAPINPGGQQAAVSHVEFCYGEKSQTTGSTGPNTYVAPPPCVYTVDSVETKEGTFTRFSYTVSGGGDHCQAATGFVVATGGFSTSLVGIGGCVVSHDTPAGWTYVSGTGQFKWSSSLAGKSLAGVKFSVLMQGHYSVAGAPTGDVSAVLTAGDPFAFLAKAPLVCQGVGP